VQSINKRRVESGIVERQAESQSTHEKRRGLERVVKEVESAIIEGKKQDRIHGVVETAEPVLSRSTMGVLGVQGITKQKQE